MNIVNQFFCQDTIENYCIINKLIKNQNIKKIDNNNYLNSLLEKLNSINIGEIDIIKENVDNINISKNMFMIDDIHNKIKKLDKKYFIKFDNVEINIYYNDLLVDINKIILIYKWLHSIHNTQKQVFITIYLLPDKKKLNDELILNKNHVNSGSTTNREYITIWRHEEVYKVLIHELIHLFSYDIEDTMRIGKIIKDKFNIEGNVIPNEAYTEIWTIILHSMFIAKILLSKTRLNNYYDLFKWILYNETSFSLYQTAKILKHFNGQINQRTSVFSYYIIKTSLLYNINNFIKTNTLLINEFSDENLFYDIVMNSLSNIKFIDEIDKIKDISNNTMRMSLFQFNLM